MTNIEWADVTKNGVVGCTRISEGCLNCYIERTLPMRIGGLQFDGPGIGATLPVQLHPDRFTQLLRWRKGRRVFIDSMGDLFHADVPDKHIAATFAAMAATPQHTYQLLTKRPARMRNMLDDQGFQSMVIDEWDALREEYPNHAADRVGWDWWPLPHIWIGVSVENQRWADIRIPQLLDTPAAVRWISAEPLLGPVDLGAWMSGECTCDPLIPLPPVAGVHLDGCPRLRRSGLNWVVAGGETGPGARPMHPDWARSLRDQCCRGDVPFLFKQWGDWGYQERPDWPVGDVWSQPDRHCWVHRATGETKPFGEFAGADCRDYALMHRVGKKAAGRDLDRRTWDEYPIGGGA